MKIGSASSILQWNEVGDQGDEFPTPFLIADKGVDVGIVGRGIECDGRGLAVT